MSQGFKVGQRIGIGGHHRPDGTNEIVVIQRIDADGILLTCPVHGGEWNLVIGTVLRSRDPVHELHPLGQEDAKAQAEVAGTGLIMLRSTPRCPWCVAEGGAS